MGLVTYEPKNWIDHFFNYDSAVPSHRTEPYYGVQSGHPKVNIKENENEFHLTAAVPGWAEKEIDLEIKEGTLTLKGHREQESESEGEHYRIREFGHQSFSRSFRLGEQIDQDRVTAKMAHGVLNVVLPKKEEVKPKSVKVEIGK